MRSMLLNHHRSDVEKLGNATIPSSDFQAVEKGRRCRRFIILGAAGVILAIVVSLIVGFSITKMMAANGRDHSKAKAVVSNSSIVNKFPELQAIFDGNARFQAEHTHDEELSVLTVNGQHPNFTFTGCSDSRVSESLLFDSPVGSMFSDRNVANQYVGEEVKTVVAYSVEELNVAHILVVGSYGCGGAQAAIASAPEESADEPGMARVQE